MLKKTPLMLPAKGQDITPKTVALDGNVKWMVASKLQAIGSDQKRELQKHFSQMVEAKQHFEKEAAKFRKMLERVPNISICQDEAELLITWNGSLVVHLAFMADTRDCA